ncbi:hypothetical protein [Leptospira noguchii]|nr:hypothetical protein [Leptospira noguchii]UOG29999.1 hypothetical protein MAL06_15445 [Leptospira noguchii]
MGKVMLRVALQGRVNSAKRFLRKRFRVDKLKSMTKFRITFLYTIY